MLRSSGRGLGSGRTLLRVRRGMVCDGTAGKAVLSPMYASEQYIKAHLICMVVVS